MDNAEMDVNLPEKETGTSSKDAAPKRLGPYGIDLDALPPDVMRELIKLVVNENMADATKDKKKEQAKLLSKVFEKGMSPREALGMTDAQFAELYSYAYYLFGQKKYNESKELFKFLSTLDPKNTDFFISIGVCYHQLKDYEGALTFYLMANGLNAEDPLPSFYAYDCYMNLKLALFAGLSLCDAIGRCGDLPKYAKLKQRAEFLLQTPQQTFAVESGVIPKKEEEG